VTISYKVSDNLKNDIIDYYKDLKRDKTPEYAIFQAEEGGTIVTLYNSSKIVFQGISADVDANMWFDIEMHRNNRDVRNELSQKESKTDKKEITDNKLFYYSAIGSDEVGTGDLFGPIVVTASFVDKKQIPELLELGIKDSKKITDDKINKIAPVVIKICPHVTYILDNETYNNNPACNMNKTKAILHNKALVSILKKDNYPYEKIIMDQFVYPKKYFEHIKDAKEKVTKITFVTKGEDKNLSVAVSSVISRYIFINEINKISEKYHMVIPKGAGTKADEVAKIIKEKYGIDELKKIAKMNFKNIDKL